MATIIVKDVKTVEVEDGKRLVLALEDAGIDILHRCGGNARCTTCRVAFIEGEPETITAAELERLEARELVGTARLSCQILTDGAMSLEVLQRLSTSDLDNAGQRPEDSITPSPVWMQNPSL